MRKYILGLLFALVMLTVLVSAFLYMRGGSQQAASPTLRTLLGKQSCQNACWLEIEPGVTTKQLVQNILEANAVVFRQVPLPEPEKNTVYDLVFSEDNNSFGAIATSGETVSQITLPIDVCISRIIDEYGTPAEVQESGNYVSLLYPDPGLVFNVSLNDPKRAASVFITSPAVFDLNFAGESFENNWEAYKDRFSGECSDNLASSVLAEYVS